MKIRLAILESDKAYLSRIVTVFNTRYTDKLEIYSFSTEENIFQRLAEDRIDVLLASDGFEIDIQKLPARCGFAYLVESTDVESLWGQPVLGKFQKADLIYKQILNIFSEKTAAITGNNKFDGGKVIAFAGAAGGVGCSSAAAACTMYFAQKGKKAIYLNLEPLGDTDLYFSGEGQGNFSDIIYAVKSRKANLSLKMESLVRQDATGVFFFAAPNTAPDMLELKQEEIIEIIMELKTSGGYDYIILDIDFQLSIEKLNLFKNCDEVVFVSDGTRVTNRKTEKLIQAMQILEKQGMGRRIYDIRVLYNRFSSRTSRKMDSLEIRELGGIKRFEDYSAAQLNAKIAEQDVFRELE